MKRILILHENMNQEIRRLNVLRITVVDEENKIDFAISRSSDYDIYQIEDTLKMVASGLGVDTQAVKEMFNQGGYLEDTKEDKDFWNHLQGEEGC
jgi:hypothetical protein